MKKKSEKQQDLDKLKTELGKVSTVILSTFQGISVEDDTKLRRAVQAAGGKYKVVKNTLAELAGKVEFRVDKAGIVHCPIGKIKFDAPKLAENAHSVIAAVVKAKPAAAKGKYVKKITLTSTMGPGINIDLDEAETLATAA